MSDQNLVALIIVFVVGLIVGMLLTLLTNKVRSGSASPAAVKKEMEEYQDKVEAHFDESSVKFKQLADQYSDLYKHLSIGATTLCRPENISPGLIADNNPLIEKLEAETKTVIEPEQETNPVEPNQTSQDANPETDIETGTETEIETDLKTDIDADTDAKIQAELEKLKAEQVEMKMDARSEKN